jgi:hypothetical protein
MGGKQLTGRKRFILVDTQGRLLGMIYLAAVHLLLKRLAPVTVAT